ncbi:enoyl-CoA hydratase/isomerase family protein [Pseudofrankia inefficax]|uniref:Enoyl-CoA hydratase/isomerase n=1 Tax=Pseudofrankia inefficax (strain DSM 45817 / CECT 9037 / DDB 130130 / EuI1c) TaxID=298654 RepID=E3JBZ8_PSEI1|nr:enoyl-CoA hydratase/isomerase family protein [Pseudofrankia inefficax]ADP82308.1 Enoyl-CoA hydratase/isomerase [Pseudofrankia inefficax]
MTDGRVLMERNPEAGVARITLNCPERRNSYDAAMRGQLAAYLDDAAGDDDVKVVLLRGAGGYFSAGADMRNAYAWYGEAPPRDEAGTGGAAATNGAATSNGAASNGRAANGAGRRRPSQRRRLAVDRRSFGFYHEFLGFPKATVAEVRGLALGGGFELALMADLAVVGRDAKLGMPATRFLGPALGSLHMFFHRLGPVLARRLLLTGDTVPGADLEHLGIFTEIVDDADVARRAEWWARKVSRMPADGLVLAKEAFRLVEQLQAYQGEEVLSYLFHAYGTNLSFEEGEFNFVRTRAQHGVKRAFELRDEHFEVPEP